MARCYYSGSVNGAGGRAAGMTLRGLRAAGAAAPTSGRRASARIGRGRAAPRGAQGLAVAFGVGLPDGFGGGVPPPAFLLSQSFLTSAITAVASRMPPA